LLNYENAGRIVEVRDKLDQRIIVKEDGERDFELVFL